MKLIRTLALMIGMVTMANAEVYELRTYTTLPGRLSALNARFRNHTVKLFEKHGMKNIGYWVPQEEPGKSNKLIYLISHKSRDAAKASWDAFRKDPAWLKARDASEADGKIVDKVESVFMDAQDYSPLK
ncbi:MAG: NIPSNAP family protein [Acidobacteriia bacterium]|nr:NIPSNAP family protein [Terriglobia bacterium]